MFHVFKTLNLTHNKRVTAKINVGVICFKAE